MNELPQDRDAAELLDDFLARIQAGESPDKSQLLQARPDLASALKCLEALEGLALGGATARPMEEIEDADAPEPAGDFPRPFGPYELLGEIGRGGMGVVYKARQTALDRVVAIKMILSSQLASPEHVRRFHVEAHAAARLKDANVVGVIEFNRMQGTYYIAMEYIEGESLAQRIARQGVDFAAAVRILAAVARAVDRLHQQNIIHRDLKPSNILLDRSGVPYVTDFGLAKMFLPDSESTASGIIGGTFSYMAPEQAGGQGEVGPAADIYSLGAILYELLAGRPPFREDTPLDTWMAVLGSEPVAARTINPRVPVGLELICLKCLAKSPAERYASAGALADDLDRFARGEPLEVKPPRLGQQLWSWTRRQPALALRLGGLGVFCFVEWINFLSEKLDLKFHLTMLAILVLWAVVALVCQRFLKPNRPSIWARFIWGLLDSLLLFVVLLVADGVASPLIIGYPLLIVGSGLWFRVRYVWFITLLSLLSYSIHLADFYARRATEIQFPMRFDRHVIFMVALCVMAAGVAYLVHRVRTLSNFYGRQVP
jgi:eukaryotic-like serine/threonine-protein kinase